ncbi:MAG: hypothetical protein ACI8ZM_002453 [Crocinitomix sp.]|jgi:hypothetical protein
MVPSKLMRKMKQILQFTFICLAMFSCANNSMTEEEEALFEENKTATESIFETWNFRINFLNRLSIQIDSTSVADEVTINADFKEGRCWVRCLEDKYNYYHSDSLDLIVFNLDYSQREFAQTNYVTLIQTLPKSIEGYPGREYQFTYDNSDEITMRRVYLVHNRLYEIGYKGSSSEIYTIELEDFFNSFTLVNMPKNPIPYLNIPTDEELVDSPFSVSFFGPTKTVVEIAEMDDGKMATVITEANEVNNEDGSGLIFLSVSLMIFPDDYEDLGFEFYMENSLNSLRQLDPSFVILSEDVGKNNASYRATRVLSEEKCFHNLRYVLKNGNFYVISTLSLYNSPEDERIKAFFDSFQILR